MPGPTDIKHLHQSRNHARGRIKKENTEHSRQPPTQNPNKTQPQDLNPHSLLEFLCEDVVRHLHIGKHHNLLYFGVNQFCKVVSLDLTI